MFDEDGTLIGEFLADLLVEGCLVVELKTAKKLAPEHEAQILGYLKSARIEHGLLINFGSYRFEIRKFAWNPARQTAIRCGGMGNLTAFLFAAVAVLFRMNG